MGILDWLLGNKSKQITTRKSAKEPKEKRTVKPNIVKLKKEKNVEGLINALKDKDGRVREVAADALREIGDPRAVEPLQALEELEQVEEKEIQMQLEQKKKEDEQRLQKELKKEIKKSEGWEPIGLHCPKCNSMDMRHKTVNIIGYLYIHTHELPDTLVKCFNCGDTSAYRGMRRLR